MNPNDLATRLPLRCYIRDPTTGETVEIRRGEVPCGTAPSSAGTPRAPTRPCGSKPTHDEHTERHAAPRTTRGWRNSCPPVLEWHP